jgi:uncharacterized membrane protein
MTEEHYQGSLNPDTAAERRSATAAHRPSASPVRAPVAKRGSGGRLLLIGAVGLALFAIGALAGVVMRQGGLPSLAQAETIKSTPADSKSRGSRVAADASRPTTLFDDHIKSAGIAECTDVFPLLALPATTDAAFTASSAWNSENSSAHAIQSNVGLTFDTPSLKGKGASVVYGAPVGGKCEGMFVRVVPVVQDCATFQSGLPAESKLASDLGGIPLITLPTGYQSMLVPSAGNGCVVITTMRAAG